MAARRSTRWISRAGPALRVEAHAPAPRPAPPSPSQAGAFSGGKSGPHSPSENFDVKVSSFVIDALGCDAKACDVHPVLALTIKDSDFASRVKSNLLLAPGAQLVGSQMKAAKTEHSIRSSLTADVLCVEAWDAKGAPRRARAPRRAAPHYARAPRRPHPLSSPPPTTPSPIAQSVATSTSAAAATR